MTFAIICSFTAIPPGTQGFSGKFAGRNAIPEDPGGCAPPENRYNLSRNNRFLGKKPLMPFPGRNPESASKKESRL
jgi:hypothetical protein